MPGQSDRGDIIISETLITISSEELVVFFYLSAQCSADVINRGKHRHEVKRGQGGHVLSYK